VDGLQAAIDDKLDTDGDGSNLTGIDSLPSQSGNADKFLTTNGSAASWGAAGGGAWEYISTTTASTASTVDFETFSTSYDRFMITFSFQASTDKNLWARVKTDYGSGSVYPSTETQHDTMYLRWTNTTSTPSWASSISQSAWKLSAGGNVAINRDIIGTIFLHHPNDTASMPFISWELTYPFSTNSNHVTGLGRWSNDHTGMEGFRILMEEGTLTGSFNLYGLKTS
jgi:hypothetical protein